MTLNEIKVPPHSLDNEMAVLGACFIRPDIIRKVGQVLDTGDFYKEAHAYIFNALVDLGSAADPFTVAHWLNSDGFLDRSGGEEYLFEFAKVSTSAGWEHHAKIVKEMAVRRQIINQCLNINEQTYGLHNDLTEIISELKEGAKSFGDNKQDDIGNLELYTRIYEDLGNTDISPGIDFGIQNIDDHHMLETGCTTVVAAESGTGKSAFCLQVADYVARRYGSVLYFSMESTREKLGVRQIARRSNIALTRIQKKNLQSDGEWEDIQNAVSDLSESRLTIIDNTKYQQIERLASFCESWILDNPLKLVVIDYLQLLSSSGSTQNRHLEISGIAKKINFLAKELKLPIIFVSQLGKDIEKRTKNRPTLGDLKESGDIRNHADNILFLYSPSPENTVYPVECFLAKGKDQQYFSTWLSFDGNYQRFENGEEPDKPLVSYGGYDG